MQQGMISSKQLQINKANTTIVVAVAVCSVLTVFCLVICKSLFSQYGYQSRVIEQQEKALKVAKANVAAVDPLLAAYQSFDATNPNMIGGTVDGTGDRDGDNAKIVLDALPAKNDVPAVISSIEKILKEKGFGTGSGIVATDTGDTIDTANTTEAVAIPFEITVKGPYANIQNLISTLEHSIRPITVLNIDLSGDEAGMTMSLKANTYYQPGKTLNVSTKVVK